MKSGGSSSGRCPASTLALDRDHVDSVNPLHDVLDIDVDSAK